MFNPLSGTACDDNAILDSLVYLTVSLNKI